jgi:LmbE family N-acetylglucosaminyl deacetylase
VRAPRREVVLAVSPHLDDAVLSAGATLAAMAAEGNRVVVCTVFSGSPKPAFSVVAEDFHAACGLGPDAMVVRQSEDIHALAAIGAEPLHLDFLDAVYRRHGDNWLCGSHGSWMSDDLPTEPALAEEVQRALRLVIADLAPARILTCAALGGHVDHRITRTATLSAAAWRKTTLWEDVPYAFDLPPGRTTVNPFPALSEEHMRAKLAAVGRYSSQIRVLWPGQDWEHVLLEQAAVRGLSGGFEVLWAAGSDEAWS